VNSAFVALVGLDDGGDSKFYKNVITGGVMGVRIGASIFGFPEEATNFVVHDNVFDDVGFDVFLDVTATGNTVISRQVFIDVRDNGTDNHLVGKINEV